MKEKVTGIESPEDVLEFHRDYIEQTYGDNDVPLQMYAMKDNKLFKVNVSNRDLMKNVVDYVRSQKKNIDWACILFTGYVKTVTTDYIEDYEYGDLSEESEKTEANIVQVFHPENSIISYYTKNMELIKKKSSENTDIRGDLII